MNTYTKILLTTLPLMVIFLFTIVGTAYYFSRTALVDLGETWLDTRLSEAMVIVTSQEQMLNEYGLAAISASVIKAQMDAAEEIANIGVGELGYIFGVDTTGTIVFHPSKYMVDTDVSKDRWFQELQNNTERLVMDMRQEDSLARFAYFQPWDWYILAVDPMEEVYGVASRMRPYLYAMGVFAALIISLALMLLTRRLTRPLKDLVYGAENIGKGELDTRIPIQSNDEFGHLAKEFNKMAFRLKETLTALQYSEEHFRALIENARDLIWILDARGTFRYVSPSTRRVLGYEAEMLLGANAFDFLHPEDREAAWERFQKRIQGTLPDRTTEQRFKHQDNYYCTLESISSNLLDHPAIRGVVINSRNITQRKKAELALQRSHQDLEKRVEERTRNLTLLNQALNTEVLVRKQKEMELEKANQAKSEFLANVSHEIRTPLNSVLGFSEVLFSTARDDEQKNYIQAIATAGGNLMGLVSNILDLSQIQAGKLDIKKASVSLHTMFQEIHHLFSVKLEKKKLQFFVQIDADMPDYLFLDDIRLRQVLTNLVENAVKFTQKGHIRLSARIIDRPSSETLDLAIQIQDTGMGIPNDKQALIFEPFEQENADISRKYGGTGLGLGISKRLVELMDGRIRVDSRPGEGSAFEIVLPKTAVSTAGKGPDASESAETAEPGNLWKYAEAVEAASDLSWADFRQALVQHPDLLPLIKARIIPLIPDMHEGMKISDARDIAEDIMDMGRQFDLASFRKFGRQLHQHTQAFDVERITLCLEQVSAILETLDPA
jgi:PAS domain S-box-containing protein